MRFPLPLLRCLASRARDDRGTAVTEFAMAFGLYMLVVIGTIQIALWAFTLSMSQFAAWEGCRAGVAAYQPPPADGRGTGGLDDQQAVEDSEWENNAIQAASARAEALLQWVPVTENFENLAVSVQEADVQPGQSGQREIQLSFDVRPLILVPLAEQILGTASGPEGFKFTRGCRLHLVRFYSF